MAAHEPTDRGAARGDSPLERYVRQLLRDADRMRRTTPPRIRADRPLRVERPPRDVAADDRPPAAA